VAVDAYTLHISVSAGCGRVAFAWARPDAVLQRGHLTDFAAAAPHHATVLATLVHAQQQGITLTDTLLKPLAAHNYTLDEVAVTRIVESYHCLAVRRLPADSMQCSD
jgi:hypothetical protein